MRYRGVMPSVTVTTRNKSYFAGPDLEPWQILLDDGEWLYSWN